MKILTSIKIVLFTSLCKFFLKKFLPSIENCINAIILFSEETFCKKFADVHEEHTAKS